MDLFSIVIVIIFLVITITGGCLCYFCIQRLAYCCELCPRPSCNCTCVPSDFQLKKTNSHFQNYFLLEDGESFGQHSCMICLEDMKITEDLFRALCRHKFHRKCLKRWLQEYDRCPICSGSVGLVPVTEISLELFDEHIP